MTLQEKIAELLDSYFPEHKDCECSSCLAFIYGLKEFLEKDILELIGPNREWDTTEPYDNPDMAQGYNEALEDVRLKLKDYLK